ncbi:colanic acid/amylovoran biosynthesis protein [Anaerocolumna jejuensis DSM 15929]|uniref:Colanic acid/amylovoran biosynthesis protein n=1 Tax=Anaerocolumna jejuensis DSM 15929 TaxID=1121322 RepID=A0A1M7C052_9FIRM|nr:polysaccharide pyruvyl transferase family protein [Anaerocolumna jejuensis]SHL60577.1 colanic acid/amylovoran biosynthesis protein [Anaerocolumna jejuensis DSM 15929]
MNVLIYGANWYNRGDESAIRAMIDEFRNLYPDSSMRIHVNNGELCDFNYDDIKQVRNFSYPYGRNKLKLLPYYLSLYSKGRMNLMNKNERNNFRDFIEAVNWSDMAVYAPGGPMLGDYYDVKFLLDQLLLIRHMKKPYVFFAPSMGPFTKNKRKIKKILTGASLICLREEVSKGFLESLHIKNEATVTLDSAFQHRIDMQENQQLLEQDISLKNFLDSHERIIGITITDLKWHKNYCRENLSDTITAAFDPFIDKLIREGFGIIFIPQLFGRANDSGYMSGFARENCYVLPEKYDCYFQQYLISRLYAIVGMRYHSNIFSAKMGTPFLSVSYEQKMLGFMKKSGLEEYCIDIRKLSFEKLEELFTKLQADYPVYKKALAEKIPRFREQSYETTQLVSEVIQKMGL